MPAQPWDSIALARSRPAQEVRADFAEARANPCLSCESSPCCWYLPLQTFDPTTYLDVDGLYKLLLFDHIELGLSSGGQWSAYYVYPCQFLNRESLLCGVHETDLQPKTCVYYKPYGCWYRRVLSGPISEEYVRVDLTRFQEIAPMFKFDDNRRVVATPPWEKVKEICELIAIAEIDLGLPDEPRPDITIVDPALAAPPPDPQAGNADFLDVLADPCEPCPAPCCTYLSFPMGQPDTWMSFDFLRFALGFPGTEIGVADGGWWLTVATTCRHLDTETSKCSVFGEPERPLSCGYYNQWQCGYRNEFLRPLPDGFARVRYPSLPMLAALFEFDSDGKVLHLPEVAEVHAALLMTWQELIAAATAGEIPGPDAGDGDGPDGGNGDPAEFLAHNPEGDPAQGVRKRGPIIQFLAPTPGSEAWQLAVGG